MALSVPSFDADRIGRLFMKQLLAGAGAPAVNFREPAGEPGLADPDSVSWRIFRNPVSLFVGGITAVLLELAEPRVRSGVWEHTAFRTNPVARIKRTGMAAMVTVYAARSVAEQMISRVNRMHARINGSTSGGVSYNANDPELLNWVQITAGFGFLEAYHAYVEPLSASDRNRSFAEAAIPSALYGATGAARNEQELADQFAAMKPHLEASPVIFEFLDIVRRAPLLPLPLRPVQWMLIRAGVDLLPADIRAIIHLGPNLGLRPWEARMVRRAGRLSDRLVIPGSPPVDACKRLGLPPGRKLT